MGVRIKECRESECLSVIERIEIETLSHVKTSRILRGLSLRETVRKLNFVAIAMKNSESKRNYV